MQKELENIHRRVLARMEQRMEEQSRTKKDKKPSEKVFNINVIDVIMY